MEEPWHYRNKAQYPVGYDKNGELVTGFYAGRTHDIIANTDCPLGAPENKEILEAVLTYMRENQVSAYRESEGTGLVRHILIRTGFPSGEIMVCIVANGDRLPREECLVETLRNLRFAERPGNTVTSISLSINKENTNVIMGKEIRVLWGEERIKDSIGDLVFSISPLSFYQVNPVQTEKLYGLALEYAGLTGRETVWDLYCGIGTISLFLAKKAKQVYGVEVVPEAIEDARENARNNGINNAQFFVGKAEEVLPAFYEGRISTGNAAVPYAGKAYESGVKIDVDGMLENGRGTECTLADEQMRHPDVIVVDPPRKGCDEKCLETMLAMQPERIVYVSCDSATLARDLKALCEGGYELKRVRAVDQFGHSVHVEVVCLLSNRKPDTKVRIDVDLEDYYRIKGSKKNQN